MWAPPIHATGQAWTDWLHATVRAAFLPPQGCWWDMTAALVGLPPVDPRKAAPTPFWAALIDQASQPTSIPGAAYGGRSVYRRRGSSDERSLTQRHR